MLICVRLCIYACTHTHTNIYTFYIYMPIAEHRRSHAKHSLCPDPLPGRVLEDRLLCASYYVFAQHKSRSNWKLIWRVAPVQTLSSEPLSSELKHYLFVHLSPGTVGFLSDRCMPHASHFPTSLLHLPPHTLHTLWPLSKCCKRGGSVSDSLHTLHNNFMPEYKCFLLPSNPTCKETKQNKHHFPNNWMP